MKLLKSSSSKGSAMVLACEYGVGRTLDDIYSTYSISKKDAWCGCFEKYLATPKHDNFRITGYNSNFFTIAWNGLYKGEPALFVETYANSYVVLLDK